MYNSASADTSPWRSRGYLPHFDQPNILQSITFRLADALPASALESMEQEVMREPLGKRATVRRMRIEHWLDAGHGCCALEHPEMAAIMEAALHYFDGTRYRLLEWCIMPNHVHVLIETFVPLAGIVRSWKGFTGRWAMKHDVELELHAPRPNFWMHDYWDRFIRDETHCQAVVEYIRSNPVSAGLCGKPEDWSWSSARRSVSE